MRYLIVIFIAVMLSGCGHRADDNKPFYEAPKLASTQKTPEASALDMQQELLLLHANCAGKAYGLGTKDMTFVPRCERDPTLAILKKYHAPALDVFQYQLDERIALFEQRQKQKITDAQLQAKLSELQVKVKGMQNSRLNDELQGLALDQPPMIIQQAPVAPSVAYPKPPEHLHCNSSIDKAGNGSMDCY